MGSCPLCCQDRATRLFESRDRVHGVPGIFAVLRCASCAAIFYEPRLRREELAAFYPDSYGRYRRARSLERKAYHGFRRFVLEHYYGYPLRNGGNVRLWKRGAAFCLSFVAAKGAIPFRGEGKFLDVGCGSGSYLYRLRQWGWKVYGVEPSPAGAAQARSLGLAVHLGELTDANFPSGFFDIVRLHHVLEHLSNPRETLVEIRRIMKPEGIVQITVPNTGSLNFWLFGPNWYGLDIPRHVISYGPKAFRLLCRATGFEVANLRCRSGPFGFVRSLSYFLEENAYHWPKWVRHIDWPRNKFVRRTLKPLFSVLDVLSLGDVMVATLKIAGAK